MFNLRVKNLFGTISVCLFQKESKINTSGNSFCLCQRCNYFTGCSGAPKAKYFSIAMRSFSVIGHGRFLWTAQPIHAHNQKNQVIGGQLKVELTSILHKENLDFCKEDK